MLALTLTADLEGVTDLLPADHAHDPFLYTFKVQCTSCREVHPNWVSISRFETSNVSGSKGDANFVWKCKNCKRESTASIRGPPAPYVYHSPPKPQKILEIDCRGLEFIAFRADGAWKAKGVESPMQFVDIDLMEGEWFDYDESVKSEVIIKDLRWEIARA